MSNILALPAELLDEVIAQLVMKIGIRRAVLLRSVCRAFNSALLHAICDAQVVDINHPYTPTLEYRIDARLRSRIWARKAMTPEGRGTPHLAAIWYIVSKPKSLAKGLNVKDSQGWFEIVAGGVSEWKPDLPFPKFWADEAQRLHLLCGVALLGIEQLFTRSLRKFGDLASAVNNKPDFFDQPLVLAVSRGHVEIVRHLLALGACLNLDAHQCRSPHESKFWRSSGSGDDQADFGLQDGYIQRSVFSMGDNTALIASIRNNRDEILDLFLEPQHRLPITSLEYFRAIVAAAEAGRTDLLNRLFSTIGKSLGDVPALHRFLLCAAARGGHQSLVQPLLDSGIDINNIDSDEGWDGASESPAARQVAALGYTSLLRYHLERGALAKFPDNFGNEPQPLDLAVKKGRVEAVHLLLDCGADPTLAVSYAAADDQLPLIKSLAKRYPELLRQDNWDCGRHALRSVVGTRARLETITFLVEAGVPLNDGYEQPRFVPLNEAKANSNIPMFIIDHLLALGGPAD